MLSRKRPQAALNAIIMTPDEPTLDDNTLAAVDQYVARLQAGERPSKSEVLAAHPELASMLECLDALENLAPPPPLQRGPGLPDVQTDAPTLAQDLAFVHAPDAPLAERPSNIFGKFELLHELGRGGMGVVYKARQVDLERIVALKMILRSQLSALALADLCYRTLLEDGAEALRAVKCQVVTPALERLVEANTLLSGLGFESSGLAAAHAIHNGLTAAPATHGYFHGEKVAYGLLTQLVLEGQPRAVVEEVLQFATEVGLPVTLAEVGLSDLPVVLLREVAARATAQGETIHNEPFEVRPDMVADAVLAADALGRAWKKHQ
jgi:hypothetical protein